MDAPSISFVIPVRNDAVRLGRCLASIRANQARGPVELIVADNGSTDGSGDTARELGAAVVDLPHRPVSEVRNAAARMAQANLLAFVDADHTVSTDWTATAIALLADPTVWAVGADYRAPAEGTWVQRMYDNLRTRAPEPQATDWLPSGNMVVRRSAFERVGGFDTGLESCEDVDLCRKLREAGGRLLAADALNSVHYGDARTLRALFLAELWRGRDNLRVTLRDRLTVRSMIGLGLTVLQLLSLVAILGGLLTFALGGLAVAAAGLTLSMLLIGARAVRLVSRIPRRGLRARHVAEALLVAAAYDTARAIAPVLRVGHDVRRSPER